MSAEGRLKLCKACKKNTSKRKLKTPCSTCQHNQPRIFKANAEAIELFSSLQTQWRSNGFGVVGLDYNALYLVAKTHRIKITPKFLSKIQVLEYEFLQAQAKKSQA